MPDFTNKTIVVTGGAQGVVQHLLTRNANVVIADDYGETWDELVGNLGAPDRSWYIPTDVGGYEIGHSLHRPNYLSIWRY